jgi:hypothetical protein
MAACIRAQAQAVGLQLLETYRSKQQRGNNVVSCFFHLQHSLYSYLVAAGMQAEQKHEQQQPADGKCTWQGCQLQQLLQVDACNMAA